MPKPVASSSASSKTIRQFCLIHHWLADEAAAQRFWSLYWDISSRKSVVARIHCWVTCRRPEAGARK
jgi:hypothetical protein